MTELETPAISAKMPNINMTIAIITSIYEKPDSLLVFIDLTLSYEATNALPLCFQNLTAALPPNIVIALTSFVLRGVVPPGTDGGQINKVALIGLPKWLTTEPSR